MFFSPWILRMLSWMSFDVFTDSESIIYVCKNMTVPDINYWGLLFTTFLIPLRRAILEVKPVWFNLYRLVVF
jgi:hypothetical protein